MASLLTLTVDPDRIATALESIADTLRRAFPPVEPPFCPAAEEPLDRSDAPPDNISYSESAEEFEERSRQDAVYVSALGLPMSPDLRSTLTEMRDHLTRPRVEHDETTGEVTRREGFSEQEAEQIVADAFREARAAQNHRP